MTCIFSSKIVKKSGKIIPYILLKIVSIPADHSTIKNTFSFLAI